MNKKIFGGIAIVAIALAVAFNVTLGNQKQDTTSMLALANVEALAEPEELPEVVVIGTIHGKNDFWSFWTHGATKDEEAGERVCPTTETTSGGIGATIYGVPIGVNVTHTETNPISRKETVCKYGFLNCTPVAC